MAGQKLFQFPMRNPQLFSTEINCQALNSGRLSRILYAAIRALPHVNDQIRREELKRALCDLLLDQPNRSA